MPTRETFLDLDDYGRSNSPDFCSRVNVSVEIDGPSDYYVDVSDYATGQPLDLNKLSVRDQGVVMKWVHGAIEDAYLD